MCRPRSTASAALALAALAGPLAAPAQGASGLIYKTTELKPLPAGAQVTAVARCPNDTSVVGGGIEISDANTATGISSSYPTDDGDKGKRPDDGWVAIANSRSAGDKQLRATAVCSRSGRYTYVARHGFLGPGETTEYAECPIGETVTGGGASVATGSTSRGLASTALTYDGSGYGSGWDATAVDPSPDPFTPMTVFAICARSGHYRYVERFGEVSDGAQGELAAPCPGRTKVVAGGGEIRTGSALGELAGSVPYGDAMRATDDGWWMAANNLNSGDKRPIEAYAVCRR
jgi:hypothetical protein